MLRRIVLLPDGDPSNPSAFSGITHFLTAALTARCQELGLDLLVVDVSHVVPTETLLRHHAAGASAEMRAVELLSEHKRAADRMQRILREDRRVGDVVLSMNPLFPFVGVLRSPVVYYVDCSVVSFYLHPVHGTVPPLSRHRAIRRALRWLEGRALRMASSVCCFSDAARLELGEVYGLARKKVCVVGAGMNTRLFPPYRRRAASRTVDVLFVGRDFARKGGPLALEAVRRLDPRAFRLTCVTYPDEAASYVRREPNVRVIGPIPRAQVMRLMREADLLIAPSAVEPYGMAIVEAMGHSLPVIASRCFAIPEILGPENPGLLRTNSVAACAALLERFATDRDLYGRVSLSNYLRAQDHFHWRDVAARLIVCAAEVVGGR